jgi:hypothetical protein
MPEIASGLGRVVLVVALLALGLVLAQRLFLGFMAQRPADYAETGPAFDLPAALGGPLVASGVIYGPTGRVATRFTADMQGTWDAAGGRLDESFRYDTGRTQQRAWQITTAADGRFTASADDVVGTGQGRVSLRPAQEGPRHGAQARALSQGRRGRAHRARLRHAKGAQDRRPQG